MNKIGLLPGAPTAWASLARLWQGGEQPRCLGWGQSCSSSGAMASHGAGSQRTTADAYISFFNCDDPKQPEGHGARGIWANRQGSAASGKCLQPLARRAPVITRWLTYVQLSPSRGQGSSLGERPGIEGRRSQNGRCKVFVYCTSLNPYILSKTLDTAVDILKVI